MSDLINRQDAIDAINHICPVDTEYDCTLLDRVDVRRVLSDLPSADSNRRVGEWNETTESIGWEEVSCAECSVCGETFVLGDYTMDDIKLEFNYCPNCGAKMERREE